MSYLEAEARNALLTCDANFDRYHEVEYESAKKARVTTSSSFNQFKYLLICRFTFPALFH
jgi:hypothetical protein